VLRWCEFEIQSVKGKPCLAFMCQNLKIESNSEFIQSCILLHGSMTQGEFFSPVCCGFNEDFKNHLKICISPFCPSGYERKELQTHLMCSFLQQWGLQYYAEHKFPKFWLSSWEARSGFGCEMAVGTSFNSFLFGRHIFIFS